MRGHRPQVPGLQYTWQNVHVYRVTTTTCQQSDVRVRSTQIGVPEWQYHHGVEVEYNGAYGWRHNSNYATNLLIL